MVHLLLKTIASENLSHHVMRWYGQSDQCTANLLDDLHTPETPILVLKTGQHWCIETEVLGVGHSIEVHLSAKVDVHDSLYNF